MSIDMKDIIALADAHQLPAEAVLAAQRRIEFLSKGELSGGNAEGWWYRHGGKWHGAYSEELEALGDLLIEVTR